MSQSRLSFLFVIAIGGWVGDASGGEPSGILSLEDDSYRVEVSRDNGAVTRIRDKIAGLELLEEPRLADNFRFTLPLRGPTAWQSTEANYILGKDQRLSAHTVESRRMTLQWNGPLTSVFGKPYDISVGMTIGLVAAAVRFDFRIDNRTPLEIGEVFAPILGGTLGLGRNLAQRRQTEVLLPAGAGLERRNVFHTFANMSWLGVIGPEQFYSYPDVLSMPWIDLYQPAEKRGVYFGAHDPVARYKLIHLEMSPGISGPRADGNWPRPEESRGLPVGVKISLVHMPYEPGARIFETSPVVVAAHHGDWRAAADMYGRGFVSRYGRGSSEQPWMTTTIAVQELPRVTFKELPARAKAAAGCGIGEILLTDWKAGGHADGIPRFEPDPSLGSRDEFAAALRQCRELGVKVTLRANLQPVSRKSDWYRSQLERFACRDRWGVVATQLGWGSGASLTDAFASGERRVWLSTSPPEMQRIIVGQMCQLAQAGVDGIYFHDFLARPLDFNRETGKTPDRASWEGAVECLHAVVDACSAVQPGFSVSTNTAWDQMLAVSQTPSIEAPAESPLRTALPLFRPIAVVAEPDDFHSINEATMFGSRIRLAASQPPVDSPEMHELATYLKATVAAREALRQTLLEGEFLPEAGLKVQGRVRYGVFRNRQSQLRSVVLVNERANPEAVEIDFPGETSRKPLVLWQLAAGAAPCTLPAKFTIAGDQLAIMTEEPALERLDKIARWSVPGGMGRRRVVVEFHSPGDLQGWTLQGEAFSVCSAPGIFRKCTLNSFGKAGESATGMATSPPLTIAPEFDSLEIVFHGGRSVRTDRGLNLVLRAVEAGSGRVLLERPPPGTHVLTTQLVPLNDLRGKTVRLQLIDENTAASYAWIGVRKVSLVATKP